MATRSTLMALPSLLQQKFDSSFKATPMTEAQYGTTYGTGKTDAARLGMTDAEYAAYLKKSTADVNPTVQAQQKSDAYAPVQQDMQNIAQYVNLGTAASPEALKTADLYKEQIDMNPTLANTLNTAQNSSASTFTNPDNQGYGYQFNTLNTLPQLLNQPTQFSSSPTQYVGAPNTQDTMLYDATTGQSTPASSFQGVSQEPSASNVQTSQADLLSQQTDLARQSMINEITEQQRIAEAGYTKAESELGDQYRQQRTNADVQAQIIAKRLQEQNVNLGLATGSQAQEQLEQQNALMGTLGGLTMQEQAARDTLATDQANTQAQGAYALQQGELGLQQQAIDNAIAQQQYNDQLALQQADITGMYQGQQTMDAQNQAYTQKINERAYQLELAGLASDAAYNQAQLEMQQAGYTGIYQGQQTMQAKQTEQQIMATDIANKTAQMQLDALPQQIASDLLASEQQYNLGQLEINDYYNQVNAAEAITLTPDNTFDSNAADDFIKQISSSNLINTHPSSGKISYNKDGIVRMLDVLASDPSISDSTLDYLATYYGI